MRRLAHAQPYPRELLGPQGGYDAFQSVVPARAPGRPYPHRARRQRHLVRKHQHPLRRHLVELRSRAHSLAREVHQRLRQHEQHLPPAYLCHAGQRTPARAVYLEPQLLRKRLRHHEARVVPRARIPRAGIAQEHEDPLGPAAPSEQHRLSRTARRSRPPRISSLSPRQRWARPRYSLSSNTWACLSDRVSCRAG